MKMFALPAVAAVLVVSGCATSQPSETQTPPPVTTESAAPATDTVTDTSTAPPSADLPEGATHSIGAVVESPTEGQQVVLGGEITEMRGAEDFILSDGTGEIFVDGDNDFGALAVGDVLLVTGTVDIEDSPAGVEIQATAVARR